MKNYSIFILFSIFIVLLSTSFFWQVPADYLKEFLGSNLVLGASLFLFLVIFSTVFAPFNVIFLIPTVSIFLGPFNTFILSVTGWLIGSVLAFLIARYIGGPVLGKIVSEKDIIKYNKYIPKDINFWWFVLIRVVTPVDIVSYLVGLLTRMSLSKYILATFIGIIPKSFILAYGYETLLLQDKQLFAFISFFVLVMFFSGWYIRYKS